ncbi:reticulocalbin-2 isoform X2 [Girardinichthys multiradiatus]|uniref:reticulocalbin-2 isoform X2 n=1 Tax=Girardinichthys multiradiatus TaxID=208333 RepID=UPI001FAD46FF|nr:reticulocalbin-2 isoform X2 [Girardinichthys multiradiatus]
MEHVLLFFLLMLQFEVGQLGSHEHLHEDHYIGQQHNPDHDMAVLLGEESTKAIKKLSPAEKRKKMMQIVKKIDTNGDNLLSAEEITLWIQHVYRKYALEDAEERFTEFDINKDGVVTWEESSSVAHDQLITFDDDTILGDPEQESLRQLLLKEKRRFDFADVDGTPGLNVTEFLAFTHPSEVDYMADFAIEDVLNEYDTDKDGFVALSEYIGNVNHHHSGRLKKLCDLKSCTTRMRMADWIEMSSCAGLRLIAMVQRERKHFTSSRKWTRMEMGRFLCQKF